MGISVFFTDKKLKIPIYGNFDARSPNSGSKTVPEGYFAKKSRNHSITDFPIFEDFCGWKKIERSLEKMVNFAQNTNFDIFLQKLNMKAHFPNFSDFLHVWCVFYNIWKLVILKVMLCLGYSKVVVMNSHLKGGENWPSRQN